MSATETSKRPWLAALFAVVITGLGHLYLREWFRAAMWYGFALSAALIFIPESTVQALVDSGAQPPLTEIAPILMVQMLSVIDAYRLALRRNAMVGKTPCPYCGRPLDEDLQFCHWCTTQLEVSEETEGVFSR